MPTEHPTYKNLRAPANSQELGGDFMWDVRAEQASESPDDSSEPVADEPSESVSQPSMVASDDVGSPASDLLRRFPRPGASANRHAQSRRTSPVVWLIGGLVAVATAAGAAWMVATGL
ncbi:MAG: hypothetical protein AAF211_12795 [Myxococcota bacterium]